MAGRRANHLWVSTSATEDTEEERGKRWGRPLVVVLPGRPSLGVIISMATFFLLFHGSFSLRCKLRMTEMRKIKNNLKIVVADT